MRAYSDIRWLPDSERRLPQQKHNVEDFEGCSNYCVCEILEPMIITSFTQPACVHIVTCSPAARDFGSEYPKQRIHKGSCANKLNRYDIEF
jgi:hypothetical protein